MLRCHTLHAPQFVVCQNEIGNHDSSPFETKHGGFVWRIIQWVRVVFAFLIIETSVCQHTNSEVFLSS